MPSPNKLSACRSCGDPTARFKCTLCRCTISDRCKTCHLELDHKVLPSVDSLGSSRGGNSRHLSNEQYHGENSRDNR